MIAFDNEATAYDAWYTTKKGALIDEVETALAMELLRPEKTMRILDVGCGTGNYSIKLATLGCHVTAIDVSENMLDIARTKALKKNLDIDFRIGAVENLEFENESFDAVVSVTAIEFFDDVQKGFEEMFRVAKKEAPIVVGTINKESAWGELYETPYFKENTVFRYANLVGKSMLSKIKADKLIDFKESLFFLPDTPEEDLNLDLENSLSEKNRGGFICGLWKK
jgi:ubiquinone/menaquinone biosynthesis C-methylase UbiE